MSRPAYKAFACAIATVIACSAFAASKVSKETKYIKNNAHELDEALFMLNTATVKLNEGKLPKDTAKNLSGTLKRMNKLSSKLPSVSASDTGLRIAISSTQYAYDAAKNKSSDATAAKATILSAVNTASLAIVESKTFALLHTADPEVVLGNSDTLRPISTYFPYDDLAGEWGDYSQRRVYVNPALPAFATIEVRSRDYAVYVVKLRVVYADGTKSVWDNFTLGTFYIRYDTERDEYDTYGNPGRRVLTLSPGKKINYVEVEGITASDSAADSIQIRGLGMF